MKGILFVSILAPANICQESETANSFVKTLLPLVMYEKYVGRASKGFFRALHPFQALDYTSSVLAHLDI